MRQFFITAVGTGVGKTLVMTVLCHQLNTLGRRVSALKPVVSGYSDDDPESDPALILRSLGQSPTSEAIATIAPWRFTAPLSPHLAARREDRSIPMEDVLAFCSEPGDGDVDVRLIEGAGGLMSPIGPRETCLDWIVGLNAPVILVTGTYLGAISHTLTALDVSRNHGVDVSGVVVSESLESAGLADTVESLREFVGRDFRLLVLPRLSGGVLDRWRTAPPLISLCRYDLDDA